MAEATWADYRLFPYEMVLAAREVEALAGQTATATPEGLEFPDVAAQLIADRASYFSSVRTSESVVSTRQADVEQRHASLRGSEQRRQATRYGLHGIHEYKGKFNPQVVRALTNAIDSEADVLIDPFCGSGTSLVEAVRLGMDAIGVDRSPMAVLLSRTKAATFTEPDPGVLRHEFCGLVRDIARDMKEAQQTTLPPSLVGVLPAESESYLQSWFPEEAFAAVAVALRATATAKRRTTAHALAEVALSSILRAVSLQLPEDLRVRRRPKPFDPPSVWELFLETCDNIEAGLKEIEGWPAVRGKAEAILGSASDPSWLTACADRRRRFLLTSPPYATALPYIDTDRLSILALGLASVSELRNLEMELVGSREWRKASERAWWARLNANLDCLPAPVIALVQDIRARNSAGTAGFRRAAVPALLYRYFARMGECFGAWRVGLRSGELAVLIVGNNHTTAGGERIVIRTPTLLGYVAESRGYSVEEIIPLETWPRYGLHGRNGVSGEDALVVRRL